MAYENPSVADFKTFFSRDFPFGVDPNTSVLDSDVTKAFTLANVNINPDNWPDQASYTVGYLYISAHYMSMNLRASSQGINGQFGWLQQSKSVGSVSESFGIPQRILENPEFAFLCKTNYGAQFLQLLLPQLSGQVYAIRGSTRP